MLSRIRHWWWRRHVPIWGVFGDEHHVDLIPLGDLIEHEQSAECACGPRVELHHDAAGADVWMNLHASLDGREHGARAKA
jgi:hypothetical protein